MMKKIYYILVCGIILLAAGCKKGPDPYISKQDAEKLAGLVEPPITNVAFIYKNNIYYATDFTKPVTQITSDGSASKFVRMSHDHTKFAYLNASNVIEIVDNKGALVTTLPQYTQVKSFDWTADDKTLYILNNSAMAYYGTSLNLPDFTGPGGVVGSVVEVLSASVSMQGDFAYVVHTFDFNNGDQYSLVINPANNGKSISYTDPNQATMNYVCFSTNQQDLAVGYGDPGSISGAESQIDVFTGLNSTPVLSYSGGCSPVYNSAINFIVGGFADANNNGLVEPSAIYAGPGQTTTFIGENVTHSLMLTNYSFNGVVYTDWK